MLLILLLVATNITRPSHTLDTPYIWSSAQKWLYTLKGGKQLSERNDLGTISMQISSKVLCCICDKD